MRELGMQNSGDLCMLHTPYVSILGTRDIYISQHAVADTRYFIVKFFFEISLLIKCSSFVKA